MDREDHTVEMHVVAMVAVMVAAGAAVSAFVAQRGETVLIPVRVKRPR